MRKHLYWTEVVSDILRDRAAGKMGTLILIGQSQGGNDSIEIARGLDVSRVPVDLLVTFDPIARSPFPQMWAGDQLLSARRLGPGARSRGRLPRQARRARRGARRRPVDLTFNCGVDARGDEPT
jgi:hypothetical protein